ncbi:hypothetical protein B0J13DRAFT_611381 [Dactylonectria estremocensis]|uniref:Uncharacterized protein n=1 Tax=Dactylonectria estremocensis TaxID=1079267 RepID=A0A9P9IMC0_9HYPO|nr:hypothetical protein B0J13DRAFT_611381 [Dactylonectria estremocensis]
MQPSLSVLVSIFGVLAMTSMALDEVGEEYCEGDGSICQARSKLANSCKQKTAGAYFKCNCESGLIPLARACDYCRQYFGDVVYLGDEYSSSLCSDDGYTVAAIPSSIISAQKARNKTVTVPDWTQESTSSYASATITPISIEPYTTTLPQLTAATLPTMALATETSSNGCDGRDRPFMTAVCVVLAVGLSYNL